MEETGWLETRRTTTLIRSTERIVTGREIYTEKFIQTSRKIFYAYLRHIVQIIRKIKPDVLNLDDEA